MQTDRACAAIEAEHKGVKVLFHCVSAILRPGSIIEPGYHGRLINLAPANSGPKIIEEIFETHRRHEYPAAISRFNCVFAFDDEAAVENYISGMERFCIVYQIEPLRVDTIINRRDPSYIEYLDYDPDQDSHEYRLGIHECAASYFREEANRDTIFADVLIGGAIRILHQAYGSW